MIRGAGFQAAKLRRNRQVENLPHVIFKVLSATSLAIFAMIACKCVLIDV